MIRINIFFYTVGFGDNIKWTSLNESLKAAEKRYALKTEHMSEI